MSGVRLTVLNVMLMDDQEAVGVDLMVGQAIAQLASGQMVHGLEKADSTRSKAEAKSAFAAYYLSLWQSGRRLTLSDLTDHAAYHRKPRK